MDPKIKNLNVILLIAGAGKRISNLSKNPKCLLKIGKKTILKKNLDIWKKIGLKKIFMVLGYKSKVVEKELKGLNNYFKITKVYNKNYNKYGNSYSLLLALKKINGPVIIFDGDLIYDEKILYSFLHHSSANSILTGPGKINDKECAKVLLDKNGHVKKIIDKEHVTKKKYNKLKFLGEALGIIKLSSQHAKKLRKSLSFFLSNKNNVNLNWEKTFNFFLEKNIINYYFIKSKKWIEIDVKKDFIKALRIVKKYNI